MIKIQKSDFLDEFCEYMSNYISSSELINAILLEEHKYMKETLLDHLDEFEKELSASGYVVVDDE